MIDYYVVKFSYKNNFFVIWFSDDDNDGVITENSKIKIFKSREEALSYAKKENLHCDEEIIEYDIQSLIDFLETFKTGKFNSQVVYDFWSIFSDISQSTKESFIGDSEIYTELYGKLFYSLNLPSINQTDKKYSPNWSEGEIADLKKIMMDGLKALNIFL